MKSKILFQTEGNQYLQDMTNNYLLYLPDELYHQIKKRLEQSEITHEKSSNYYERKAQFLMEKYDTNHHPQNRKQ